MPPAQMLMDSKGFRSTRTGLSDNRTNRNVLTADMTWPEASPAVLLVVVSLSDSGRREPG